MIITMISMCPPRRPGFKLTYLIIIMMAQRARVDWIAGLPTTAGGFDMIRNHIDLLSGKVPAVPTRSESTATAADATAIITFATCASGPRASRAPTCY